MKIPEEIKSLKGLLDKLKKERKILLAYLYGSYAGERQHKRSDIDLAVYLSAADEKERTNILDSILMTSDKQINILMLDDEDESPFVIQEALKGIPLIDPDLEMLYSVAHNALHEAENIRYKRAIASV
ncbi:MAG: nucleotidyltransferase domain-containing protein [Nitrospirae bacterium]|nr:nucleotidyltransferase domain-containing protein [Nitrospirota bacterium]